MQLGAGAGRGLVQRSLEQPGSSSQQQCRSHGASAVLQSPGERNVQNTILRSDTRHKICSLMMFGNHLISFMAELTPYWKSENRGHKNIIFAKTEKGETILFNRCAMVNFKRDSIVGY